MRVGNVIVTLELSGLQPLDIEAPAFMPADELAGKLLESLKVMLPDMFLGASGLRLFFDGKEMPGGSTLASVGAWDGTVIKAVRR